MESRKRTARLTGLVYLCVVITGIYVLIYVPGRLFVDGNAGATVNNILAHQTLFRSYILVGVVANEVCSPEAIDCLLLSLGLRGS